MGQGMALDYNTFGILELISKTPSFSHRTRIQKMLMLAQEESHFPSSFKFNRWHYGPYSPELQELLSSLVADGFVEERGEEMAGFRYSITEKGLELRSKLQKEVPKKDSQKIERVWDTYKNYSYSAIVQKAKKVYGW